MQRKFFSTRRNCKPLLVLSNRSTLTEPSFLLAYYAAKDVCEQVNVRGIEEAASKRHKDANVIYAVTLRQIESLAVPKKSLAHKTIAWLTFAKKPFEENELQEAFALDNQNGRVDPAAQFDVENIVEYCRGLVVRVKIRRVLYLRLAHMSAQEYFSQVESFQQYHADMCLTCIVYVISCLPSDRRVDHVHDSYDDQRDGAYMAHNDLDGVADDHISDSSADEASKTPNSPGAEEDDEVYSAEKNEENDDDKTSEVLSDDSDSWTIFEDYQSWQSGEDEWPETLLPWVAKRTPFSLYAGLYALSHLKDSTITCDLEKTVLNFINAAISRRRRCTFSGDLQHHPFRMNELHMASFIGIPSIVDEVLRIPGIYIDDRDILGRTALMWALGLGNETVAEKILEEGAQIQAYDRRQRSTLTYASAVKSEALLTRLLRKVSEKDIDASLLSSCAKANNVCLIDGVLSRVKINLDRIDENGRAPIHEAVASGSQAAVHSLIGHGAQVLVLDHDGRTPLIYAAQSRIAIWWTF